MLRKKKSAEPPSLGEILEGVDIVGTILDQELPRLQADLKSIKTTIEAVQKAGKLHSADSDLLDMLTEIRDMLEQQEHRLIKLDARLAQLEAEFAQSDGHGPEIH